MIAILCNINLLSPERGLRNGPLKVRTAGGQTRDIPGSNAIRLRVMCSLTPAGRQCLAYENRRVLSHDEICVRGIQVTGQEPNYAKGNVLVALRWDDIDLTTGRLHVWTNRVATRTYCSPINGQ